MLWFLPVKCVLLHNVGKLGFVRKEQRQISGQNTRLHSLKNLIVLFIVEVLENIVSLLSCIVMKLFNKQIFVYLLQYHDSHVKMMILHGGA